MSETRIRVLRQEIADRQRELNRLTSQTLPTANFSEDTPADQMQLHNQILRLARSSGLSYSEAFQVLSR